MISINKDTPDKKLFKLIQPRKMNKLKEWSISSRILRGIIDNAIHERVSEGYKFRSVYDSRYSMFRIWNVKTQNVVCTVKPNIYNKNGKELNAIIRYRPNSVYAPMMSALNGIVVDSKSKYSQPRKIISIPSTRLGTHRGNSTRALEGLVADKDKLLASRLRMVSLKILEENNNVFNNILKEYNEMYTQDYAFSDHFALHSSYGMVWR